MIRPPPRSPLFPYTTLFRSQPLPPLFAWSAPPSPARRCRFPIQDFISASIPGFALGFSSSSFWTCARASPSPVASSTRSFSSLLPCPGSPPCSPSTAASPASAGGGVCFFPLPVCGFLPVRSPRGVAGLRLAAGGSLPSRRRFVRQFLTFPPPHVPELLFPATFL